MKIRLLPAALVLLTHAASAVRAADPAQQIKVEVRLLEMSSRQADLVEQTLLRWNAHPAEQGAQLDQLLWGNGAKKITELSVIAEPGKTASAKNVQKQVQMSAHDEAAIPQNSGFYNVGDTMEFMGALARDSGACDGNLAFRRSLPLDALRLERCNYSGAVTFFNGLPVFLGRRDFGSSSAVLIARGTWAAPIRRPANSTIASPIMVRATAYTIPQPLFAEAAKFLGEPSSPEDWFKKHGELADWLKKRGTPVATISTATRSGQRPRFEHQVEEIFLTAQKTRETRTTTGVRFDAEVSLGAAGDTVEIAGGGLFSQPRGEGSLPTTGIAGRYLRFTLPTKVPLKAGSATAVSTEELPGWATGAFGLKIITPADVFVVLQPVWIPPRPAAPVPARQTPAPATPAPAAR